MLDESVTTTPSGMHSRSFARSNRLVDRRVVGGISGWR